MNESLSDLSARYREEMLRMYGTRPKQTHDEDLRDEAENAPDLPASPASDPPPPLDGTQKETEEDDAADGGDTAFDYDPPALPDYVSPYPVPELPAQWSAQDAYEERNTAEGFLRVITAAADSAYPVAGARVTVSTRIGGETFLNYVLLTDENGETPTVSLPAPPPELSQDPAHEDPFALCHILAEAQGFYPGEAQEVPVFAGVTSRQVFQMVPLPLRPGAGAEEPNNPAGRDT